MSATPASPTQQERRLRVFLCHSSGDKRAVRDLYVRLKADGFSPWLDEEELLPGHSWQEEISIAVRTCDVVLVCLSQRSVSKEGYLQREIKDALSAAEEKPERTIFVIPVRLEPVEVPDRLNQWQWANLFEKDGYHHLTRALAARANAIGLTDTCRGSQAPAPAFPKRIVLASVLIFVLVAGAVGGYLFHLYGTTKKMQESNRAIDEQMAQLEQNSAAVLKADEAKAQEALSPTPGPQQQTGTDSANPAQSQIELQVESKPPGASVEIDHHTDTAWVTPFKVSNIGAGKHTLGFAKPGFVPEKRSIVLAAGKPVTFNLTLSPIATRLLVDSTPQGASIEVDGQATGQFTPASVNVEKGEHTVVLRKVGYNDVSTTQSVDEGQTANVSPTLALPTMRMERPGFFAKIFGGGGQPAIPSGKGVVRINTAPVGATIQVGDKTSQLKTPVLWITEPGTYDIVLRMDGFQPVSHRVQVVKGRPTPVDEVLVKLP